MFLSDYKNLKLNFFGTTLMRIVQLVTDRTRYFNPSKNYWFSFNAFFISLIGLCFRCLSFRVVLVNTARLQTNKNGNYQYMNLLLIPDQLTQLNQMIRIVSCSIIANIFAFVYKQERIIRFQRRHEELHPDGQYTNHLSIGRAFQNVQNIPCPHVITLYAVRIRITELICT